MFSASSITTPQIERFQQEVECGAKHASCSVCYNISVLFAENMGFELKINPQLCMPEKVRGRDQAALMRDK